MLRCCRLRRPCARPFVLQPFLLPSARHWPALHRHLSSASSSPPSSSAPLSSASTDSYGSKWNVTTPPSGVGGESQRGRRIEDEDDYQQKIEEINRHTPSTTQSPTLSSSSSSSSSSPPPPFSPHAYFHPPSSSSSTSFPPHLAAAGGASSAQPLYETVTDLTDHFMRALHLSEQTRFVKGIAAGLSVLALVGLGMWTFRDTVKTSTAEQVADVAKRSLADSDVQQQVNTLSQEVVQRILTDPTVLNTALQFTTRLLHEESTQRALSALLHSLLLDPQTLERAHVFSTQLVQTLTSSPSVQQMTADLVRGAIQQPENKAQLVALLQSVVNDDKSLAELRKVGSSSAHDVLNDASVQQHMTAFMKGVLADSTLQQTAGDALWSAVRYSFRPKWGGNGKTMTEPMTANTASSSTIPPAAAALSASPPIASSSSPPAPPALSEGLPPPIPSVLVTPLPLPSSVADQTTSSEAANVLLLSTAPPPPPPLPPALPSSSFASETEAHGVVVQPPHPSISPDGEGVQFALASVDEDVELIPTFTITVNSQPH